MTDEGFELVDGADADEYEYEDEGEGEEAPSQLVARIVLAGMALLGHGNIYGFAIALKCNLDIGNARLE